MATTPDSVDALLARIRALPAEDRERVRAALLTDATSRSSVDPRSVIGLFRDDPDLMANVAEDAMQSRERDPLRVSSGEEPHRH